jgi:predicted kinase
VTADPSPEDVERHANIIRSLCVAGAALSQVSPHASIVNPAWFFNPAQPTRERAALHAEILRPYRDQLAGGIGREKIAYVLAGPPGAGKSRILDELIGEKGSPHRARWLEIDPDDIKKALLRSAVKDGSYETFIKPPVVHDLERQGERFFPLDFASLVHEESSLLAKQVRSEAIKSGANIVIDTVLSKPAEAAALGQWLARAGYTIRVIDVEVPFNVSAERVARRWRDDYIDARLGKNPDGGRWVPEDYVRSVYANSVDNPPRPGARAVCQESALRLTAQCDSVTQYTRYWTPAPGAKRVIEINRGRANVGDPLLDQTAPGG